MKKLLFLLFILIGTLQAQLNGVEWKVATIDSGSYLFSEIDLRGENVKLIAIALGDTSWDTANVTIAPILKVDTNLTTSLPSDIVDSVGAFLDADEAEYTITVGAIAHLQVYYVDPTVAAGLELFKFRSGTYGTPVTQTSDIKLYYAVRPY